jgi:hypothetical protein
MKQLKSVGISVLFLAAVLLAGCAAPPPSPAASPVAQLVCPSDFCRKSDLSADQTAGCAEKTSRRVEDFAQLDLSMNLQQVCARVGRPDWDAGSGLMIEVYDLTDGSQVLLGFGGPSQMVYIHQVLPDGSARVLAGK